MSIFKRFHNAIKKETRSNVPVEQTTGITANITVIPIYI